MAATEKRLKRWGRAFFAAVFAAAVWSALSFAQDQAAPKKCSGDGADGDRRNCDGQR